MNSKNEDMMSCVLLLKGSKVKRSLNVVTVLSYGSVRRRIKPLNHGYLTVLWRIR